MRRHLFEANLCMAVNLLSDIGHVYLCVVSLSSSNQVLEARSVAIAGKRVKG